MSSSTAAALRDDPTAASTGRARANSTGTITLLRQLAYDWRCYAREGRTIFSPLAMTGFWVVAVHRYGAWAKGVSAPIVGPLLRAAYRITKGFVVLVTGARIGIAAQIGQRLNVHTTQGLQIAGAVRIGDDCVVNSGVCIVHAANNRRAGAPTIGNNVYLGEGRQQRADRSQRRGRSGHSRQHDRAVADASGAAAAVAGRQACAGI
jgi:hypothetical protein